MNGTIHVIGAGLAGLSAAVEAAQRGRPVIVYEAAPHAGGRCRSFYDKTLDRVIDNGSHAIVGANRAVFSYLRTLGASDQLVGANQSGDLSFYDCASEERWSINPGVWGPMWTLIPNRRPPNTTVRSFLRGVRLLWAGEDDTVADVLPHTDDSWTRFWQPLCIAVMNTQPEHASARLFGRAVLKMALTVRGGLQTYVPRETLEATFVTPALKFLAANGSVIRFNSPLKTVTADGDNPVLAFRDDTVVPAPHDRVIISTPPWIDMLNELPQAHPTPAYDPSAIVNCHFKVRMPSGFASGGVLGIIHGTAEWIFTRTDVVSVTVSAANSLAQKTQGAIAEILWADVSNALGLVETALPPHRVIIEHRATPAQTPAFVRTRIGPRTRWPTIFRAGDWVETGLPCTLESAVLSGRNAARLALEVE